MAKIKPPKNPKATEIDYRNYLIRCMGRVIDFASKGNNRGVENATRAAAKKAEQVGKGISAHVIREIKKNLKDGLKGEVSNSIIKKLTDRALSIDDKLRLNAFVYYNTALIKNVSGEVQLKIFDEIRKDPTGLPPLEQRIKDVTGFSDARVRLIARDQTSKLNSELSAMRHKAAGFTKYQWTTSGDERVREEHVDLDGNIYRYDEPTDEQDGLQPGQPINCRCLAEPIFDGLNDE